ncbi:MAG: MMPL family transporter, partial [Isosphaeraceae bacterium]
MPLDKLLTVLSRRPAWVIVAWAGLATAVGFGSPNLTRLAAEGQAKLLGHASESRRASEMVRRAWPDQAYESTVVLALHRPAGLTDSDRRFAISLAQRFESADRPGDVLRVLGPMSRPEIAERLVSQDKTVSLLVVPLDSSYVSPTAHKAIAWMQSRAEELRGQTPAVAGLELRWTGDSVIGRDYMAQVQTSLDRAALATVVLLLVVLLLVYRSLLLALVPLATIGVSLIIARGVLAWLNLAGWQISPLVELFLVAILFGTGTDFCL